VHFHSSFIHVIQTQDTLEENYTDCLRSTSSSSMIDGLLLYDFSTLKLGWNDEADEGRHVRNESLFDEHVINKYQARKRKSL